MRKLLVSIVACMLLAGSAVGADESTKAINFQFTDINGKSVQLSDFKGKWVLVNFWAPWCPLCWVEVPALNELNKRKDFVVIGIGLDYGPDENIVRDAARRHNLDFYAIVAGGARRNPDSPFRQVGPVDFYPTSYLYDPNGEVVMFIPGQLKSSKVLAFMESWGPKKNALAAGSEASGPAKASETVTAVAASVSPVKEVTYIKKPMGSDKNKPKASGSRNRTVTY